MADVLTHSVPTFFHLTNAEYLISNYLLHQIPHWVPQQVSQ